MTQIICLANSKKNGGRCIAGIELKTRSWIRPIYERLPSGCIPKNIRLINGKEPQILDVLDIPLAQNTPLSSPVIENRKVLPGNWNKIGIVKATQMIKCSEPNIPILHNTDKYVKVSFLESLPFAERSSIQLIYTSKLKITSEKKSDGRTSWKGTLINNFGYGLENASITDPEFIKRIELGYRPQKPCLVTISLSMPWKPPNWQQDYPAPRWKLIAGVIELS